MEPFLTSKEQIKTFEDWGYYSAPLTFQNGTKIGDGKSKLISINTNFCYYWNWQQVVQFSDPGNMLQWLENELAELEKVGGAAIMLSHVPNINECNRQFGRRWHALMDRYQHVVRWSMTGHNHKEQF